MSKVSKSVGETDAGFTLLELLVSMALLLVISSAAIGGLTYFQKNYRTNEMRKGLQGKLRGTVEQMSQEIGQAGLVPSGLSGNVRGPLPLAPPYVFNQSTVGTLATLTAASAVSSVPITLAVTGTSGMYAGEWLILDTPNSLTPGGAPEESVQIQSVNSSTSITVYSTGQPHTPTAPNPVPVVAQGVYPMGVWTNAAASLPDVNGHAQTLTIFGDINADGNMVIVKYLCPATSTTAGPLLRQEFNVSAIPINHSCRPTLAPDLTTTLLDNVTFCQFTYPPVTVAASGNIYALSVGISLTVQSLNKDPQTGSFISVTKNILNIQPRNIVNAYNMDSNTLPSNLDMYTNQLQKLPTTSSNILSSTCMP